MYCAVSFALFAGELRSARTERIVLNRYLPVCCEIMYESPSLRAREGERVSTRAWNEGRVEGAETGTHQVTCGR